MTARWVMPCRPHAVSAGAWIEVAALIAG